MQWRGAGAAVLTGYDNIALDNEALAFLGTDDQPQVQTPLTSLAVGNKTKFRTTSPSTCWTGSL
jgi:hypothetical protein